MSVAATETGRPFALPPIGWGTAASAALHVALLVVLLLVSPIRQLVVPQPQPLTVTIVTPAELAAAIPAAPAVLAAPVAPQAVDAAPGATTAPTAPPTAPAAAAGTITATQFYAAAMLREPGMERIRKTMTTLADSERVVQLCNIEGLEQIRRAAPSTDPDTLVPYAMADMQGSGLTLLAAGGAFRSRRKWYAVSFTCTAAADYSGITGFSFKLGAPIPADQWDAHDLNAEDDEMD